MFPPASQTRTPIFSMLWSWDLELCKEVRLVTTRLLNCSWIYQSTSKGASRTYLRGYQLSFEGSEDLKTNWAGWLTFHSTLAPQRHNPITGRIEKREPP
jgi:hypothetical protein